MSKRTTVSAYFSSNIYYNKGQHICLTVMIPPKIMDRILLIVCPMMPLQMFRLLKCPSVIIHGFYLFCLQNGSPVNYLCLNLYFPLQDQCCVLHSIVGWDSTIGKWARVEGTPSDPNPNDPYAKIDSETLFREGKLTPSITILGKISFMFALFIYCSTSFFCPSCH